MKHKNNTNKEKGYVLVGVLFLIAISLLLTTGMLDSASSNSKTRALVTTQADYYYEVEETLNKVVGWLQSNSKNIVGAFLGANFGSNFDMGSPTLGGNEGIHFQVPTMVKMAGTNDSVMLSNNSFFGTTAFPATSNIDTGTPFDASSSFQNTDLGGANARIVMIWARNSDNNYEPIFRVDVITGNNPDRGVHSFSYVYSALVSAMSGTGFYGRDFLTTHSPNNDCWSYQYVYNAGAWTKGAPRSNCGVNSDATVTVKSNINGSANSLVSNGVVESGGHVSGVICAAPGCHSISLPSYTAWNVQCPMASGNNFAGNNNSLAGGCYDQVTIGNNKTLTLTDYSNPYYINSLSFNNSSSLIFAAIPETEEFNIYVNSMSANGNGHINGNHLFNSLNAPHQVKIHYLGNSGLTLNGTAEMNAAIYAPYAPVDVLGNFNFFGVIQAQSLYISGNAKINYDENLQGILVPNDLKFTLRKTSQRYR